MHPLHLLLIFLSASLTGFFIIRNLRSQPVLIMIKDYDADDEGSSSSDSSIPAFSKVTSFPQGIIAMHRVLLQKHQSLDIPFIPWNLLHQSPCWNLVGPYQVNFLLTSLRFLTSGSAWGAKKLLEKMKKYGKEQNEV